MALSPRTFLVVGFAIGCAGQSSVQLDPLPEPIPEMSTPRERLWSVADTLNVRRQAAISRYGPPDAIASKPVPGWENPATTDSIVRLQFRYFEAMYRVRADRSSSLMHVTISKPVAGIPAAARPGVTRATLVSYLGEPDEDSDFEDLEGVEGRLLLYTTKPPNEDGNVLNIFVVDGRVRWVSWVMFPEVLWPPA
jgi:hypothetical protein